MSTNEQRAMWAEACLTLFSEMTGADLPEDAMGDLIANLGHYAQCEDVDFLKVLATGIGHWHLEQIDPESFDMMPTVTITIKPHERH